MNRETLERDFMAAIAAFNAGGARAGFYDFIDDAALMVNEDIPFVLDKAAYRDHVEFLAASIDRMEWIIRAPRFRAADGSGIVSAEMTARGVAKTAGFRQRHGVLTAVCAWDGQRWRAVNIHTSTLLAHIHHASPA
jgi:hypothetical protein